MGSIANPLKLGASTANENTPLLIPNGHAPTTQTATDDATAPGIRTEDGGDEKPLPKMQIFLLCYCRLVDPIAFFSIFPFVNKMILDTGDVIEEDVGFYSGLIVSSSCRILFSGLFTNSVGIVVFINPDGDDDPVGPRRRQVWQEANSSLLALRRSCRNRLLRPEHEDLADDTIPLPVGRVRRIRRVSLPCSASGTRVADVCRVEPSAR